MNEWWKGSRFATLMFLTMFLIVLIVFVIIYVRYRHEAHEISTSTTPPPADVKRTQKTIFALALSVVSLLLFLIVNLIFAALAILILRKVEDKNLFQPVVLTGYTQLAGTLYTLPSGGLVLNTTPEARGARRVLFLHGNTGNLELYRDALEKIASFGYNVFAVEYRGYGPAKFKVPIPTKDDAAGEQEEPLVIRPSGRSMIEDALEAWALMGSADGIVAGFSIGGAILSQIYEQLVPMPAQIVFLNSFGDIRALLEDKLGQDIGTFTAPLLQTQWSIQAPITYSGKVLVVFTADDLTVPAKHGERLCQVFSKSDLVCRELPRGGHKYSVFSYFDHWANALLPPQL